MFEPFFKISLRIIEYSLRIIKKTFNAKVSILSYIFLSRCFKSQINDFFLQTDHVWILQYVCISGHPSGTAEVSCHSQRRNKLFGVWARDRCDVGRLLLTTAKHQTIIAHTCGWGLSLRRTNFCLSDLGWLIF